MIISFTYFEDREKGATDLKLLANVVQYQLNWP